MKTINYRADIDGMRAIAVLAVLFYHAFPQNLPGGFIGVDIFFVISGYLITGIIFSGLEKGDFSLKDFYFRRIRRIFPALIVILVFFLIYGYFVFFPSELSMLGKEAGSSTLFIQNIIFSQEGGYFDKSANQKPLLHLWSLGVEEQFYIFFPPLIFLIWKKKWPLLIILILLLVISFIFNLAISSKTPFATFFLTPYRAWEFLLGSLLSLWNFKRFRTQNSELRFHNWISVIACVLLVVALLVFNKKDIYPGWRALFPVLAAIMLLYSENAWINKNILSVRLIVWIGLISYPLYLVHWPLLSFLAILKGKYSSNSYTLGAIILSFGLAAGIHHFIERNIRFNRSKWTVPLLVTVFASIGILSFLVSINIIKASPVPRNIEEIQHAIQDRNFFAGVNQLIMPSHVRVFYIGKLYDNITLFIGDSNMQQYVPRINKLLINNTKINRSALIITSGGQCPVEGVCISSDNPKFFSEYHQLLKKYPQIDRVVIAARWDLYFNAHSLYFFQGSPLNQASEIDALKAFGNQIKYLVSQGKKVTVVLFIPYGDKVDPINFYERNLAGKVTLHQPILTEKEFLNNNLSLRNKLIVAATSSGAKIIDPLKDLSADGVCISENIDGPIRYDHSHLRTEYVREHIFYLDSTLDP